jgi:membrane dipeptidase
MISDLFAELIRRGWTDEELEGLAGGNTLRVLEGLERVQKEMADEKPSMARYSKRNDIGQGFPTRVASEL